MRGMVPAKFIANIIEQQQRDLKNTAYRFIYRIYANSYAKGKVCFLRNTLFIIFMCIYIVELL